MPDRNICKFITDPAKEVLGIERFIYETRRMQAEPFIIPFNTMNIVVHGNGVYSHSGLTERLSVGTLFFAFLGSEISIDGDEDLEYMYIAFSGTRAEELLRRFGINNGNSVFSNNENLIPFWRDSLARSNETTLDLVSESVLLYTFSRMSLPNDRLDKVMGEMLKFVDENFDDPEMSLQTVADHFNYNPKYVSHLFKKKIGISFTRHLKNVRIKQAISLTEHGVISIKNIALLCGYTDALYFSKIFKEQTGMSPREYMAQAGLKS